MFLYRKAADRNYQIEELTPEEKASAEVHIAKHRNGPTGVVKLFWDGARASFKNLDTRHSTQLPANALPKNGGNPSTFATSPNGSPATPASENTNLPPGIPPKGFAPKKATA
jgi:hypothetical protein